jgi:hypothetical protein
MLGAADYQLQKELLMTSHKPRWKRLFLAIACAAVAATVGTAFAGSHNFNPEHVLNAFKEPAGTVGVIAHRGMVGNGCPENSTCSIIATENNGIEAIELDVKQSAAGTPFLFHDQNVGRVAWGSGFDIYTGRGWNADVGSLSDSKLTGITLRDKEFQKTQYNVVNADEALNTVMFDAPNMLVVFDIKTLDAVSRIADMVIQHRMQNKAVLKFSASLVAGSPGSIARYTKGVAFVPTIYAGDMDNIAAHFRDNSCGSAGNGYYLCLVQSWMEQARAGNNFAWFEIGNKTPHNGDPTYALVQNLSARRQAMGAFVPVKEYRQNSNDGHWYIRSNGTCCASLNDYLTHTRHFGNEWVDDRTDPYLQVRSGFTTIITDDAWAANSAANFYGKRNTSRYF